MHINLELYRVFYYVATAGSISGAAKELFISQPAVSQSIKQLEEKLGGKLFFRTSKGIKLTTEGEVLYKYIDQAYNIIRTAENKFIEMQNLTEGEIKIGAGDTLCRYYLIPYLELFHKEYPGIKIHVTNRTTPETIDLLKSGKVDLGIINLPADVDESVTVEETISIQDCFVAGRNYRYLSEKPISLSELVTYPVMVLEKGTSTRKHIDNFAKEHGIEISPEIELGSIDLLIQFAKIGLGISCVVRNFVDEEIREGDLYEIKLIEPIPERKVGIATLKDFPLSAAAGKFIEILKKEREIHE
ncbi:MAG TPA: LysR family transcriptional regulator [Clostridiaceae bacterium]|nr:LysR family transcriptional regulator [Clostridiaceae bacterium]